jgi:hypothetical protein
MALYSTFGDPGTSQTNSQESPGNGPLLSWDPRVGHTRRSRAATGCRICRAATGVAGARRQWDVKPLRGMDRSGLLINPSPSGSAQPEMGFGSHQSRVLTGCCSHACGAFDQPSSGIPGACRRAPWLEAFWRRESLKRNSARSPALPIRSS